MSNNVGETPLHSTVRGKNVADVNLLLRNNADANIHYNQGNTPLHTSSRHGFSNISQLLIDNLRTILTPREHRKPQKSGTKIHHSTGYTLSTQDEGTPLIPLMYSQIHVTIFPPTAKLLDNPV